MWDDVAGKASHDNRDKYVVLQVILTEKWNVFQRVTKIKNQIKVSRYWLWYKELNESTGWNQ